MLSDSQWMHATLSPGENQDKKKLHCKTWVQVHNLLGNGMKSTMHLSLQGWIEF